MAKIEIPKDPNLARKVVESHSRREERLIEMGWFGRMFGSVQDKPGNIAGIAILASFLVLVSILFISAYNPMFKTDVLIPVFTGIITLALGYLFGKGSDGRKD